VQHNCISAHSAAPLKPRPAADENSRENMHLVQRVRATGMTSFIYAVKDYFKWKLKK